MREDERQIRLNTKALVETVRNFNEQMSEWTVRLDKQDAQIGQLRQQVIQLERMLKSQMALNRGPGPTV